MKKDGKELRVICHEDLKDNDKASMVAFLGAPIVAIEKICTGNEVVNAFKSLNDYMTGTSTPISLVVPAEIGGMNSIAPIYAAAQLGLPCLDSDGMGRAYPELQMVSSLIYGCKPTPLAASDEKGNNFLALQVEGDSPKNCEDFLRTTAVNYGGFLGIALNPLSKAEVKDLLVHNSISRCWRLGLSVLEARKNHSDPMVAMEKHESAKLIFTGKIINVRKGIERGFNIG